MRDYCGTALVLGAGGFIGGHLVSKLKDLGYWVRGVDIKWHEYKETDADEFIIADLRDSDCREPRNMNTWSSKLRWNLKDFEYDFKKKCIFVCATRSFTWKHIVA